MRCIQSINPCFSYNALVRLTFKNQCKTQPWVQMCTADNEMLTAFKHSDFSRSRHYYLWFCCFKATFSFHCLRHLNTRSTFKITMFGMTPEQITAQTEKTNPSADVIARTTGLMDSHPKTMLWNKNDSFEFCCMKSGCSTRSNVICFSLTT